MDIKLSELQYECDKLRNRLSTHEDLQNEVEVLKEELESSLESHKKLQEVALAFEEENRSIQSKYTEQLKDKSKLSAVKIDLEHEVESKIVSYGQLEKKYNKLKEQTENIQELEDLVHNLENQKKRNVEKIKELEATLHANYEDIDSQAKKHEDKINKLVNENNETNSKLVTYIEEMEDMDMKMENLEKENKLLKTTLEKMKEIEMFGNHMVHIQEIESEKEELMNKLKNEREQRELIENELFKTEEELEKYISNNDMYGNSEINNNLLATISEIDLDEGDEHAITVALENQIAIIQQIEDEKTSISNKAALMQEELKVLLEENSMLAKSNMELQNSKTRDGEEYEAKIAELERKLVEMEEERKQIEQDTFNRLVASAELEYESSQKQKKENEELRNELKEAQEHLGASNSKNKEMEIEIEKRERGFEEQLHAVKEDLKTELQVLKDSLEEDTRSKYEERKQKMEEEQRNFMNQMETNMQQMTEEYEGKLTEQNTTIRNLEQRITAMKSFYGSKSISTNSSAYTPPIRMRNEKCYSMGDISYIGHDSSENGDTLREVSSIENEDMMECEDVFRSNDVILRNGHNTESDIALYNDNRCGLSDREMRRISYKVAEGSWKRLSCDLPINEEKLAQIMNSSGNEQEKVYQLLNCWRTEESTVPRLNLLRQLTEYIDPNRKDVIKLLKEMAGIPTKDRRSIKNKFKKFKLTVKR